MTCYVCMKCSSRSLKNEEQYSHTGKFPLKLQNGACILVPGINSNFLVTVLEATPHFKDMNGFIAKEKLHFCNCSSLLKQLKLQDFVTTVLQTLQSSQVVCKTNYLTVSVDASVDAHMHQQKPERL